MAGSRRVRGVVGGLTLAFFMAGCGAASEEFRSAPTLAAALASSRSLAAERHAAPAQTPLLTRLFPQAAERRAASNVIGQLFVRFTPEAAAAVEQGRRSAGRPHVGIPSLDRLLEAYGVVRIEPVFSSQSTLDSGEESLGSDGIYLLDLTAANDQVSAVRAFNDDPAVIYAEAKYFPGHPLTP